MGPRTTIAAGLVTGAATALAILIAAVVLLPDPGTAARATNPPSTSPDVATPLPSTGGASPSVQATVRAVAFHVGERAPALSVPQLGGGEVDLRNLAGRPIWVNFMQTTCPPCVDEFPLMSGFAARYASTGLVVIAIDVREDEGTVASFVQSLSAQFPVGLDSDGLAAQTWGAVALPIHFWIDKDGVIRAGALGGIGPEVMAQNLDMILPGVNVTP